MLFAVSTPSPAFFIALGVAIAILLRRSYRYFGRRNRDAAPLVLTPRPDRAKPPVPPAVEFSKYEVHLHETARELTARLDNKMIAVSQLVARAEAATTQLEALLAQLNEPEATSATERTKQPASILADADASEDAQLADIYALADRGYSPVTIAHRAGVSLPDVTAALAARESLI
jgi:hypothetical protein